MSDQEVYKPAFTEPPGTNLAGISVAGLELPTAWISYGLPYHESCARHVRETFRASKVYIMASGSLSKTTDKLDKLVAAIGEKNVAGTHKGMTPHTLWSEILSIAAECREVKADCVVTLGAGTITDGAKLVVLCLANNITTSEDLARYPVDSKYPVAAVKSPRVPLVCIPTSLSGGEYFSLAGGTNDATKQKHGFLHSGMGSKLIILDPELCMTTPEYHWLSTGIRSVDHCVEALCSLQATLASDAEAEKGLRLLVPSLLKCKKDEKDLGARHKCQMAVVHAMGNARAGVPMGGSHAIGHQLGPLGVPHGVTSCIMMPAVMKYNIKHGLSNPEIFRRQELVKSILWSEPEVASTVQNTGLEQGKADLGNVLDAIIRTLDLPRTLKEMGIDKDIIPDLARTSLNDFWAQTNPVPLVQAEQVEEILESVA